MSLPVKFLGHPSLQGIDAAEVPYRMRKKAWETETQLLQFKMILEYKNKSSSETVLQGRWSAWEEGSERTVHINYNKRPPKKPN